jgi:hypothetical protein
MIAAYSAADTVGIRCSCGAAHQDEHPLYGVHSLHSLGRSAPAARLPTRGLHHSISAQTSARVAAVATVMNANASKRVRQCWRSICLRSRSLMYGFSCNRPVSS